MDMLEEFAQLMVDTVELELKLIWLLKFLE